MSVNLQEQLEHTGDHVSVRDLLRGCRKLRRERGTSTDVSRRDFLKYGTATAVAAQAIHAASENASARELHRSRRKRRATQKPSSSAQGNLDPLILTLLDQATFGFTRAAFTEASTMGFQNWLDWQLAYDLIDDSALDARLTIFDALTMTSEQILSTYGFASPVPLLQLMEAGILRAVYTRRQLYERMVEFWTDHFNIYILDDTQFLKLADDRDVIRQHALGKFPDMLRASAHSGSMLSYLDNFANVVGHAQENYARELMELHSLGVDGGFTQQDVEEVARCLTGWSFIQRTDSPFGDFGDFRFRSGDHDNNPKTFLGQTIHNPFDGIQDGNQVLDILSMHPSTARFLAFKLCKRFLSYDPPEDIITMVRDTYLSTGGDIKAMLRVIFQPTVMTYLTTPKLKRPFHYMMSLLRATDTEITDPSTLLQYLLLMGQAPFFWIPPDGYPDSLAAWSGSLLPRWQFSTALLDAAVPGTTVDYIALLLSEGGNLPGAQAAAVDRVLTGGRLPANELSLLQDFFDNGVPPGYPFAVRETFGLAASMPTFQWY